MPVYVDATPLYDLGQVGELDLLGFAAGKLVIPAAVVEEITAEPAATNLARFLEEHDVDTAPAADDHLKTAMALLEVDEPTSDAQIVAGLLAAREAGESAALVSDDRRLRAVADGLGATITGTFGVVIRAALEDKYFSATQAKRVIRRTDHHGLQMTGRLRERAVGEIG